jgi:hypothetical protein
MEMMMAKQPEVFLKEEVPADVWIGRLTDLLKIVDAMTSDERSAAFNFLRSKYGREWPSSSY